jgi:hypothetical protein
MNPRSQQTMEYRKRRRRIWWRENRSSLLMIAGIAALWIAAAWYGHRAAASARQLKPVEMVALAVGLSGWWISSSISRVADALKTHATSLDELRKLLGRNLKHM